MMRGVGRREEHLVVGLAALAAIRVFLFAAAFPFFSPIDEHRHVDMAIKYSRGYLPRPDSAAYEPETATFLGMYGTPEYHLRPWQREAGAAPPAWKRRADAMLEKIEGSRAFLARRRNLEVYQPPFHYALTGAWFNLGRWFGLEGGRLLYWLRGLNVLMIFALVLTAHKFLREAFPTNAFVRLGVPVLLTVFPQDAFYYVTQDALSPLLFAGGFFTVLRLAQSPGSSSGPYIAAGLLTSAAMLTKYTNLGLLVVCALCTTHALVHRPEGRTLRGEAGHWLWLWLMTSVPLAGWWVRNHLVLGDWLGTSFKLDGMGWGTKPFAELWDHPLFTPSGLAVFVTDLIPRFWRGQLAWYRTTLSWSGADLFYIASTGVFLLGAALGLRRSGRGAGRLLEGMSWAALLSSVACLAGLSLMFVYGEKTDPSEARPYFSHGRLISGVLVPALVLYLRGIQVATSRLPARAGPAAAWICLGLVVGVVVISEVALSRDVFLSGYNWYHLP